MTRIVSVFLSAILVGCVSQSTKNDDVHSQQSSSSSVSIVVSSSSSSIKEVISSSSLAPYTGPFHFNEEQGDFIGSITMRGYVTVEERDEAFCEENCQKFYYAFFHILDMTKVMVDYLEGMEGNSFVRPDAIGLGCVSDLERVDTMFGNILLTSTSAQPVTLTVNVPFVPPGRGVGTCHSHFTIISVEK